MYIFLTYMVVILITFYLEWLLRPNYLESFLITLPNLEWEYIGPLLLIFNYSILALSVYFATKLRRRSDAALPIGGLIAASSVGSLLSISFNFNFLWSAITPRYLLLIVVFTYAVKFLLPLMVFSLKSSEINSASEVIARKLLISKIKKLAAEVELVQLQDKKDTSEIKLIQSIIASEFIGHENIHELLIKLNEISKDCSKSNEFKVTIEGIKIELGNI